MKKFLVLMLTFAMVLCFTACKNKTDEAALEPDDEVAEDAPAEAGAWVVADNTAATLPEEVQTAFDKAAEGTGLVPVAYFGKQIVAGSNYAVLCKEDTALKVAIIYADLDGNAELTYLKDFDISDYTGGTDGEVTVDEPLTGGWEVPEDYTVLELPEDVQTAFDTALDTYMGNDFETMAFLGSQVVAGTYNAILCHSELVTEDYIESIQLVTIYTDPEGKSYISSIVTVDPAAFNE